MSFLSWYVLLSCVISYYVIYIMLHTDVCGWYLNQDGQDPKRPFHLHIQCKKPYKTLVVWEVYLPLCFVNSDLLVEDPGFVCVRSILQVVEIVLNHQNVLFLCRELVRGCVEVGFYFSLSLVQFSSHRLPFRIQLCTYLQTRFSPILIWGCDTTPKSTTTTRVSQKKNTIFTNTHWHSSCSDLFFNFKSDIIDRSLASGPFDFKSDGSLVSGPFDESEVNINAGVTNSSRIRSSSFSSFSWFDLHVTHLSIASLS